MSYWTYVSGIIDVWPLGRTQHERRYVLETVLDHLPKVTGSENDMSIHIVQKHLINSWTNCNEFGERLYPDMHSQEEFDYMLVLKGNLRDRTFDETLHELNNFLNRLAKRVGINDILIRLKGWNKELIISNPKPYDQMFESYSWVQDSDNKNMAWAEYLMWEPEDDGDYPKKLAEKYRRN